MIDHDTLEIRVLEMTQHYGIRSILRDVTLDIHRGEVIALMGVNGVGKSTLLAAMAGVLTPQKGHVEIGGLRRRSTVEAEKAIRRRVAYLPATPWLPSLMSGREFIIATGRLYEVEDGQLMAHADMLLDLFELGPQADNTIRSYSTGQQKKIAICSALITSAPILLLDEPFSGGLDPAGIFCLRKVMMQLAARADVTIVMATPVPEMVEDLADRVVIISGGTILTAATPEELKQRAGEGATFAEAIEHLMNPETAAKLGRYLEARNQ